jgi:hypothetical protein
MYKENAVYNKDLEDSTSILRLPILTVLNTVSEKQWQKREADRCRLVIDAENLRLRFLKQQYSRVLLRHPSKLGFPLRICSLKHLNLINAYVFPTFNFKITCSKHPVTKEITGMASNTFLCPMSSCFLKNVKASSICDAIYGQSSFRSKLFLPHLHTTVAELFNKVAGMVQELTEEFLRYELFESLFYGSFKDADAIICVKLYASLRISEELACMPNASVEQVIAVLLKDCPVSVHTILHEFVHGEFEWQTNPGANLKRYFYSVASRKGLTLEEFLAYLGDKLTDDEKKAATFAYEDDLARPLGTKEKKDGVEEKTEEELKEFKEQMVLLKRETHVAKLERRKNR